MRIFLYLITLLILTQACFSTRCEETDKVENPVSVDPHVRNWLSNHDEKSAERLPVIVVTNSELSEVPFLNKIGENYYTGEVNFMELKKLILDSRVKRISNSTQKLHN